MVKSLTTKTEEVHWLDAADKIQIPLKEIIENPTSKYLVRRISYGKIIKEDEHGIVILTDKDEDDDCEITTIPKRWIKK